MQNSAIEPKTDKLCAQYLAQLKEGSLSDSIAYVSAIKQAKLDYSETSLQKLESLLNQLKKKTNPDIITYQENKHKTLFLCVLSFYLGDYIAKHADKNIHWFAGNSYFANNPDKSNQLHNKFVCEIAGKFINPTGFLCDKLFQTNDKTVQEFVTQVSQHFVDAEADNIDARPATPPITEQIFNDDNLANSPLENNQTSLAVKAMSMGFTAELAALTNEQLESDKEQAIHSSNENILDDLNKNVSANTIINDESNNITTQDIELSLDHTLENKLTATAQAQPDMTLDFLEDTQHTATNSLTDNLDIPVASEQSLSATDIATSLEAELEQVLEQTPELTAEQTPSPDTLFTSDDSPVDMPPALETNDLIANPDPQQDSNVLDEASYRLQQTYKADESYEAKFNINYNSKILDSFALPKAPYIIASVPFGLLAGYCLYRVVMSILANTGLPIISTVFAVVFLLIFIAVWVIYAKSKISVFDNKVSLNTPFKNQTTRFDKRVRFFHASEEGILNAVSEHATIKSNTDMIKLKAADHDGLTDVLMEVEATLLVPSLLTRLQNGETITFELLKINNHSLQYGNKEINLSQIGDYEFDEQYLVIYQDSGEVFARINLASEPNINSFLTILTELI